MQKPFQVTDKMLKDVDAEITKALPNAYDPIGSSPRKASSLRRDVNLSNSGGTAEGPKDNTAGVEDPINPSHYRKHPSGIECIEVTRHMNFNVGNAIKYLWRYMDKGDPVENLKKAQWYLDDEIRRLGGK